jgi:hypothetical protein
MSPSIFADWFLWVAQPNHTGYLALFPSETEVYQVFLNFQNTINDFTL